MIKVNPRSVLTAAGASTLLVTAFAAAAPARSETPDSIVATQLRVQGYACEEPSTATRDRRASRPDEVVWILRCKNADYRVELIPDMAARVTKLR